MYQVWWKSINPNSSYCVHKGENAPFLRPLLYLKNSRKIRKICTTPKFKIILCYGNRASVYQVWWKSMHPNSSYRVHKGVNRPFLRPLLYLKNSRKIRKICTTPKFKLILCYGLEHVCTKFGENPSIQTQVIVSTSNFSPFWPLWPWPLTLGHKT